MKSLAKQWLSTVTASLLGVFISMGMAFAQSTPEEPAAPAAAPELTLPSVYVVNVSGPTLFAGNQDITDNGQLIASLPRLTHKQVQIAVGAHEFRFKAFPGGKRVATLNAEMGQTYYLVVGYSPAKSWAFPLMGDSMLIKLIAEDEAKPILQETKLAE